MGAPASRGRRITAFFLLAFAVSWLFWVPLALSRTGVIGVDVPALFFTLGGAGPLIAGVVLAWRENGPRAVSALLAPLLRWRVHPAWYLVAQLWPAAIGLAAYVLLRLLRVPLEVRIAPLAAIAWSALLTTLVLVVEEVGWRGYALPRLQATRTALGATLVVGLLWGLWHLPLHFLPGYPRPLPWPVASIAMFTVFTVLWSVLLTWIFNGTGGSLLLVLIAHQAFNTTNLRAVSVHPGAPFQMVGFLLLALLAVGLVWRFGSRDLAPRPRVTDPPRLSPGAGS